MEILSRVCKKSALEPIFSKTFYGVVIFVLLCWIGDMAAAEDAPSLLESSGFISHLEPNAVHVRRFELRPPRPGASYEVKVNFLKAETFGPLIDDYFDSLKVDRMAPENGEKATWSRLRNRLHGVTSRADFQVTDATGKLIQKVTHIGSLTWGRTVKFTAHSSVYTVEIRCVRGAGLFHLTFEED